MKTQRYQFWCKNGVRWPIIPIIGQIIIIIPKEQEKNSELAIAKNSKCWLMRMSKINISFPAKMRPI